MNKYFSRIALASALTLAAGVANAQRAPDQSLGNPDSLTGCLLDNHRLTITAAPNGSAQDAARSDLGKLTKEYMNNVKGIVRVITEDYTSKDTKQRPFFDHLTFALNDYSYKFNQTNKTAFILGLKAANVAADESCKTVVRLNPKP